MNNKEFFKRERIPLYYLIIVSLWWSFYYQSNSYINDFGKANFEYLYLIDGLLVLPILCLWLIKDKKEAIFKTLAYGGLVIFIAGFIIPDEEKFLIKSLEPLKYIASFLILFLEVGAFVIIIFALRSAISVGKDPDESIERPIKSLFGNSFIGEIFSIEARVWSFILFPKHIKKTNYSGQHHFDYHKKDDAKIDSLGFIFLILFEIPIIHLLLHFIWSPLGALVVSGLTSLGLFFLIAEYRSFGVRPVSILDKTLIIRYGVWNVFKIPVDKIVSIQFNNKDVRRSKSVKIYNYSGVPNIVINLKDNKYKKVYLGLDSPGDFIKKTMIAKFRG